jgi:hypothetical protein
MGQCAPPFKGIALRVTALDICGTPVTGAPSGVYVTEGFTQVQASPQYEDGEEFLERTASGALCVNERDDDLWKRDQVTIDFCEVDFDLTGFVLGGRRLDVGSPLVTGAGFALKTGPSPNHWSLEIWQRVAGEGACDPSGVQRYIYLAYPHLKSARRGDYTVQNGPSGLQIVAQSADPSPLWADGPGTTSWLAPAVVQTGEHWLFAVTTTPPPTATCGRVPLS